MGGAAHGVRCGVCAEQVAERDLVRAEALDLCRRCVQRGLTATLDSSAYPHAIEATLPSGYSTCSVCAGSSPPSSIWMPSSTSGCRICVTCLRQSYEALTKTLEVEIYRRIHFRPPEDPHAAPLLTELFGQTRVEDTVTSTRVFPDYARADLQRALDDRLKGVRCVGLHGAAQHETITFAALTDSAHQRVRAAPLQYEEVDTADDAPVRCLRNALWLAEGETPHAILLSHAMYPIRGWRIEVCVPVGLAGERVTRRLFDHLEAAVARSTTYRGKVLSLDAEAGYRGMQAPLIVHRLPDISREDIILPDQTLELLERNVFGFLAQRARLSELKMSMKKGLLFYGPPGTGKTHTIRFLASALKEHTTLLVTAGEVGSIDEYMALARLLSPSIVVIEDVDLIARDREEAGSPGVESLLNRLLNEMDGLKEEAEILFVLTTNRPETLEPALTSRPGRIDQAIEFPLPDDECRRRLVDLYRGRLSTPEHVTQEIVRRTRGTSAAFIKELMRRVAQFAGERDPNAHAAVHEDVDLAVEELLVKGGSLNARLLGAQGAIVGFE